MKVSFTKKAEKDLRSLSQIDAKRVLVKIAGLQMPFPSTYDIKKMKDTLNFYRLRIGKVRVIFEADRKEKTIYIRKIGYRGGVYF